MADVNWKAIFKYLLRSIGRTEPDIPKIHAIHNRILKSIYNKFLYNGTPELVDVLGFKMYLDPTECVDGNLFFAPHLYDKKEREFFKRHFPPKGVFLDVGSYIGFWSLYVANEFPDSTVIAIEPNPVAFMLLKKNVSINGFKNIKTFNCALLNETRRMKFLIAKHKNLGGSRLIIKEHNFLPKGEIIDVEVVKASDFLKQLNVDRIDAIKIDVEGYEINILQDIFENIESNKYPKIIIAEANNKQVLTKLLNNYDYNICVYTRENLVAIRENNIGISYA